MKLTKKEEMTADWEKTASKLLVGKTIKEVKWMSDNEANGIGWYKRPPILILNDDSIEGIVFFRPVQRDDGDTARRRIEGNGLVGHENLL